MLEPMTPTALEQELLTRLTGELGAAGLDVIRLPFSRTSDAAHAVSSEGSDFAPVAAFATQEIRGAGNASGPASTLRLWFCDRVTGTVLVEEGKEARGSSLASSLAVQGFELLQASRAVWRWRPPTSAPPAPAEPVAAPRLPPARAVSYRRELTATLHVGLLYDAPSGETALTPLARLAYAPELTRGLVPRVDLAARLSVAGFGATTVLVAEGRQVDVIQSFALLESVVSFDSGGWLRPYGSAGAGAYQVNVNGVDGAGSVGRSERTLSPLAAAGVGLAAFLGHPWVVHVEAQGLFALQPTAVQIGLTRAATLGRPLLVFDVGFGVAL